MRRVAWLAVGPVLLAAGVEGAAGDMVVQRWGVAGHVQHPGTLVYQDLGNEGTLLTFDLSALPKGSAVHRARLVLVREGSSGYGPRIEVIPAEAKGQDRAKSPVVQAAGEPLRLVGPTYRWFDAAPAVRAWVRAGRAQCQLVLRTAAAIKRERTFLEIAYEGRLADPPAQVGDVRAFYRAGQVFITFREIEDLCEGQDDYPWGKLIKKAAGYNAEMLVPKDDPREVRYRVYRSDRPITPGSIAQAELLAEVVPGSRFNTREVRRIWKGEQVPSVLDEQYIALRLAVEPEKPLPSGIGKYVHTVSAAGRGFYAVTAAVNGVENTVQIGPANTAGPVDERVEPAEPVVYRRVVHELRGDKLGRAGRDRKLDKAQYVQLWCNYYTAQPLSPLPICHDVVVGFCPQGLVKPAPVHINRGHSWVETVEPVEPSYTDRIDLAHCSDQPNAFWMGINDAHGTLKGLQDGRWQPFPQRRQVELLRWLDRTYGIDWNAISVGVGAWGMMEMERADLYADLHGWGLPEISKGFQAWQRACGVWGRPEAYKDRPDDENPFHRQDWTRYVLADPAREVPFFHMHLGWGAHFTEMGWPPVPRFLRAMIDTRRAFVYHWRVPPEERPAIRRDRSLPAFGNCSLDDNPGNGDLNCGEGMGIQLNGFLTWDAATIVDEPDRWEATVWLAGKPPLDRCTVDITPRRCQRFRPATGESFAWTNTPLPAAGKQAGAADSRHKQAAEPAEPPPGAGPAGPVQSGSAAADKHGLVTLSQVQVTTARHRIVIRRAR